MVEIACVTCGSSFEAKSRKAMYCSLKCKRKAQNAKRPVQKCAHCGGEFKPTRDAQRFCSPSCGLSGAKPSREVVCSLCGCEFQFKGRSRRYYCDHCQLVQNRRRNRDFKARNGVLPVGSGNNQWGNQNWKGRLNPGPQPRKTHTTIYTRIVDVYWDKVCRSCGLTEREPPIRFEIHHIDGDRGNNDPKNLVRLCSTCHGTLHRIANKSNLIAAADSILPGGLVVFEKCIDKVNENTAKLKPRNEAGNPGDRQPEPKSMQ